MISIQNEGNSMILHLICRDFRMRNGILLKEIGAKDNIASFEHGRSTNIKHLQAYLDKANELGLLDELLADIKEGVING